MDAYGECCDSERQAQRFSVGRSRTAGMAHCRLPMLASQPKYFCIKLSNNNCVSFNDFCTCALDLSTCLTKLANLFCSLTETFMHFISKSFGFEILSSYFWVPEQLPNKYWISLILWNNFPKSIWIIHIFGSFKNI